MPSTASARLLTNAGLTLVHFLRRWPKIKPVLADLEVYLVDVVDEDRGDCYDLGGSGRGDGHQDQY